MRYRCLLLVLMFWTTITVFSIENPKKETGAGAERIRKNAQQVERWLTLYYAKPEPDKLVWALRQLHNTKALSLPNAQQPLVAFFSVLLRDNPDITKTIVDKCSFMTRKEKTFLGFALWQAGTEVAKEQLALLAQKDPKLNSLLRVNPMEIIDRPIKSPGDIDSCWGAFLATGNTAYVDKIINCLAYKDEKKKLSKVMLYGAAKWSLTSNCRQHPVVKQHCLKVIKSSEEPIKSELKAVIDKASGKKPKKGS